MCPRKKEKQRSWVVVGTDNFRGYNKTNVTISKMDRRRKGIYWHEINSVLIFMFICIYVHIENKNKIPYDNNFLNGVDFTRVYCDSV